MLRRFSLLLSSALSILSVCSLSCSAGVLAAETESHSDQLTPNVKITIPRSSRENVKNNYIETLLIAAVKASGNQGEIEYFDFPTNQSRLDKLLTEKSKLDLAWLPANKSRLNHIFFIPVPLYKGLHGNRLLLIRESEQQTFNELSGISELAKLTGLQNKHWYDYSVLKNNGLKINGEFEYRETIKALVEGFGDYYPRSAMTVAAEYRTYSAQPIAIEENLMLYYPSYFFIFVNNHNEALQSILMTGFKTIIKTGEMNRVFQQFYGKKINGLRLKERTTIELQNKALPELLKKSLWLDW